MYLAYVPRIGIDAFFAYAPTIKLIGMKNLLRFLVICLVLSVVSVAMMLVYSFPDRPSTWLGWLTCFLLAIPLTLLGEFVGEMLQRNRLAQAVAQRTQHSGFSWMRICYMLVAALLVSSLLIYLNYLFP
jgi:hypothetical protein